MLVQHESVECLLLLAYIFMNDLFIIAVYELDIWDFSSLILFGKWELFMNIFYRVGNEVCGCFGFWE
jgi:hypothetical protein